MLRIERTDHQQSLKSGDEGWKEMVAKTAVKECRILVRRSKKRRGSLFAYRFVGPWLFDHHPKVPG